MGGESEKGDESAEGQPQESLYLEVRHLDIEDATFDKDTGEVTGDLLAVDGLKLQAHGRREVKDGSKVVWKPDANVNGTGWLLCLRSKKSGSFKAGCGVIGDDVWSDANLQYEEDSIEIECTEECTSEDVVPLADTEAYARTTSVCAAGWKARRSLTFNIQFEQMKEGLG